MNILAIDPGTRESACVHFDGREYMGHILPNKEVLSNLYCSPIDVLLIEKIESYGMAVGADVFETVYWSGRFHEAARASIIERVPRKNVKMTLCNSMRAKDSNIRQALPDRFGGKDKAIGKKANPGPLYGFKSHMWPAGS